jgi:hypothetical protein
MSALKPQPAYDVDVVVTGTPACSTAVVNPVSTVAIDGCAHVIRLGQANQVRARPYTSKAMVKARPYTSKAVHIIWR